MKKLLITLMLSFFGLSINAQTLHIYGGRDHDVYLGCLNCNSFNSNSIWNEYGTYGSSYNTNSIWNSFGTYGSEFSNYSPFSTYASYPPVIVDKEGDFYGYFTVNTLKAKRANFDLVNTIYKYYEEIQKDVSKWYKLIFD